VTIAYRRRVVDMPADDEEIEDAEAEGIEIVAQNIPLRVERTEDGRLDFVWGPAEMVAEAPGKRPKPKLIEGVENHLIVDRVIVAIGLNILVGYTGLISLGHAGFFAIGAYGTVVLMSKCHLPFLVSLPLAALSAALFGFLLGLPALRLEGPYLSIATLGFGLTITKVIGRIPFFGGRQGLHAPPLVIGSWHLDTDRKFYYLLIALTLVLAVAARNLIKTKVGRAFVAIRDADVAEEMSQFVRSQILMQSGVSMMAQANQVPSLVAQLIR
jgi:hypothetical protein